jgi:hypothetical protein
MACDLKSRPLLNPALVPAEIGALLARPAIAKIVLPAAAPRRIVGG